MCGTQQKAKGKMSLTEEAKKRYLEESGVNCPFCGSSQIEGASVEINAGSAYQPIGCLQCDKRWNDVYTLRDVEEVEP